MHDMHVMNVTGVTWGSLGGYLEATCGSLWHRFWPLGGSTKVEKRASRNHSETFGNRWKPLETLWEPLETLRNPGKSLETFKQRLKKRTFGTKWVGIARKWEISIRIDAAGSQDLENRGFGKVSLKFEGKI